MADHPPSPSVPRDAADAALTNTYVPLDDIDDAFRFFSNSFDADDAADAVSALSPSSSSSSLADASRTPSESLSPSFNTPSLGSTFVLVDDELSPPTPSEEAYTSALLLRPPAGALLPPPPLPDLQERIRSFDALTLLGAWFTAHPLVIAHVISTELPLNPRRQLLAALRSARRPSHLRSLAFRVVLRLGAMQKSRDSHLRPIAMVMYTLYTFSVGHNIVPALRVASALRLSMSRPWITSFLAEQKHQPQRPFGDCFFSAVDNCEFFLAKWSEAGGARSELWSMLLEISLPIKRDVYLRMLVALAHHGSNWQAASLSPVGRGRKKELRALLTPFFNNNALLFDTVLEIASRLHVSILPHALATDDRQRKCTVRAGYHVDSLGDDLSLCIPFLEPAHLYWRSNSRVDVGAMMVHLLRNYVHADTHPIHFVICDAQIYLQIWRIKEDDVAGKFFALIPLPGLWHLLANYLQCIYELAWNFLLGPAAAVLGRRRVSADGKLFDECERMVETVTYAIARLIGTYAPDVPLRDVIDAFERNEPSHQVLFLYAHIFSVFFEFRARIRRCDCTDIEPLLQLMLPVFVACGHHNYASVCARLLVTLQLALPEVRHAMEHCLAKSLSGRSNSGQATDMVMERSNRLAKSLINKRRMTRDGIVRTLGSLNLVADVRRVVESQTIRKFDASTNTGNDEDDDAASDAEATAHMMSGVRDDCCRQREISMLTAWLADRLGWTLFPLATPCDTLPAGIDWRAAAAVAQSMSYCLHASAADRLKPFNERDDAVARINTADDEVAQWLGGKMRTDRTWLELGNDESGVGADGE